jgi:FixJ family two-component response regulator
VVGAVADAASLRAETRRLRPDVVVAGLRLLLACPAGALSISTRTVAFHKYKTMRALGLDSSAALVRYAVRNHML